MSRLSQLLAASTIHRKPFLEVPAGETQAIADALVEQDVPDLVAVLDRTYDQWNALQRAERTEERSIDDEIDECYYYSRKIDAIVAAVRHLPAFAFSIGMRSPHRHTRVVMASAVARLACAGDVAFLREAASHSTQPEVRERLEAALVRLGPPHAPAQDASPGSRRVILALLAMLAVAFLVVALARG
jgi:hypothetical protein